MSKYFEPMGEENGVKIFRDKKTGAVGPLRKGRGYRGYYVDPNGLSNVPDKVKRKGYTADDYRIQENEIGVLRNKFDRLQKEEEYLQRSWDYAEEPTAELEDVAYARQEAEQDLYNARQKYGQMAQFPYVERKMALGRENFERLKESHKVAQAEEAIDSLYTYRDERNMGAGPEDDPMGKYEKLYGKGIVDRAWDNLNEHYDVIKGVSTDSEGLSYNQLIDSSEIDRPRDRYDINVSGEDSDMIIEDFELNRLSKYEDNLTQEQKKQEIENYAETYRLRGEPWKGVSTEDVKDVLYDNYGIEGRFADYKSDYGEGLAENVKTALKPSDYLERDVEKLKNDPYIGAKEGWSDAYAEEVRNYGKEEKSQNQQFADAIRQNKMDKDENTINDTYSVGEYGKGLYVQFQDIEKHEHEDISKYPNASAKVSSNTWARVWDGKEMVFDTTDSKYGARKQVIDYLEGRDKSDTSPMSEWSDTTGTGYSDAQIKKLEDVSRELSNIAKRTGKSDLFSEAGRKWNELYKQDKNNIGYDLDDGYRMSVGYDGGISISSSHPYDDTDYSYANKKGNNWVVNNPLSKTTSTFNSVGEAVSEMKKIDSNIQSGEKTMDNEGITRYRQRKGPAYKNPDVQREVAKSVAKAFGADSVKVGGEAIPTSLKGKADKLGVNITEAPKRTSQKTGLKTEPYKKELDRTVELGLSATSYTAGKDAEILDSISGQLSDGIWENSPGMERYWRNMDFVTENGNIKMATGSRGWYPDYSGYGGYRGGYSNPFSEKDDKQIRTYIADKAKQIVKENIKDNSSLGKWSRDNTNRVEYMGGHNAEVTVADVYSFYDRVKGRPGKKYNTYGKTSVARKDVDNIKAQVERYKKRKNK